DYVLFEITDTGIGIPADQQSRLFDYFHQGDQTSRRRYGGTGLGLAICRQLAEIMGGEIGFQSSEAGGSCFWVRLPLPAGKAQAEAAVPEQERPASVVGARLLIVDDNHINLLVAEGLCRKLGHQCETAESGA
ncbi:MAG TPA: hybrid sensor histidine kinase/response regulator, partial [Alcanivorax sp.]|nr:hybrid sensor histidine kinase/response regulator [Alcanivorax sp.]